MAKKLWGGRFTKPIDPDFELFSRSIHYDYKLAEYDIFHSLLHVNALYHSDLLSSSESKKLIKALFDILKEIENGDFEPNLDEEDIHSQMQNMLEKNIGSLANKLHTLRSRNDQIAFDVKFYCFSEAMDIMHHLSDVLNSFQSLADKYKDSPFVGYTHTQRAQIVLFSDYCKAYYEMFERDAERVESYLDHLKIRIGAGALAGSSISYTSYAKAIKELSEDNNAGITPVSNSLEHVADRDFVIELLSILSIVQMHLSRFCEDMILYSTAEFNYVDLPEEFCTGSSLMPHKKNADLMELVRGYTGRVYGDLMALLTTMKGLPLTYNRDMQLDKEPLFSSVELIEDELAMIARFVPGIQLKEDVIAQALDDEYLYGVEIAEYLVNNDVAFKDAHDIVGKLIRYSEEKKTLIKEIDDAQLEKFHVSLNQKALKKIMTPAFAVKQKKSIKRR